jgi:hypothetical protein
MKTYKVLLLALIISAVWSLSAQADNHNEGNKGSHNNGSHATAAPGRASAPTFHSASRPQFNSGRMSGPSQRFSSVGLRSAPTTFRQQHINSNGGASLGQRQFTPEAFNRGNGLARFGNNRPLRTIQGDHFARIQNDRENRLGEIQNHGGDRLGQFENRPAQNLGTILNNHDNHVGSGDPGTIQNNHDNRVGSGNPGTFQNNQDNHVGSVGNGNRGLAGGNNGVFAQRSADWHRDWDRNSDHWWRGHRCRFVNNSWFIFDLGFFPWYGYPYDYYGSDYYYPYQYGYDSGVYEGDNYYGQGAYESGQGAYESSDQDTVGAAQERLAREGYYRGAIDGVLGRGTRRAILGYQRDHGLRVTGYLTTDTLQSLGLRVAGY